MGAPPSPEDERFCWLPSDRQTGRSVSPTRSKTRPKTAPLKRAENDARATLLNNLKTASMEQKEVFERNYGTHNATKRRPRSAYSGGRVIFERSGEASSNRRPQSALARQMRTKSPTKVTLDPDVTLI